MQEIPIDILVYICSFGTNRSNWSFAIAIGDILNDYHIVTELKLKEIPKDIDNYINLTSIIINAEDLVAVPQITTKRISRLRVTPFTMYNKHLKFLDKFENLRSLDVKMNQLKGSIEINNKYLRIIDISRNDNVDIKEYPKNIKIIKF